MEKSCKKGCAHERLKKNECTRPLFKKAQLQKLTHPCLQKKQAGFKEDKRYLSTFLEQVDKMRSFDLGAVVQLNFFFKCL